MSRLIILHASDSYNYGTAMMCTNFIHYTYKKNKYKYYIDVFTLDDLDRYKKESQVKDIYQMEKYVESSATGIINRINNVYKRIKFILNLIDEIDPKAIIILGGDQLTESYSGSAIVTELLRIYLISRKKTVFLMCQNIGPFKSWRHKTAAFLLNKTKIFTRDKISYDYLVNELKMKNVYNSSDLAFLELPNQKYSEYYFELSQMYDLKENNYITIVPSGLVNHYTTNKKNYVTSWSLIIRKILESNEYKDKKVVLLSHVLMPEHADDRKIIIEIMKLISNDYKNNVIPILDEILPSDARKILGNGYLTVTGRMHAAISTFQMKKPAISLSYSLKYEGLIGGRMNLEELIIKSDNNDIWINETIVDLVFERMKYIENNYDDVVDKIGFNLNINVNLVLETLDYFVNILKNGID